MRKLIIERLSRLPVPGAGIADGLREAAVLLPLFERAAGITLLLALRTQHLHHHPGQISLPGGMIEASDASPVAAALREASEEVGIPPERVEIVGRMESIPTRTGFRIAPVVGFVASDVQLTLDRFEVEHVLEVPLEFLMSAKNYKRETRTFDGVGPVSYYALDFQGQIVWGATAQIIVNFVRHLGVSGIPES